MITIEMITAAIGSLLGLSVLIVAITQIFKNWFNKKDTRWVNHLISFLTSLGCCGIVLVMGIFGGSGIWAGFDVHNTMSWLMWAGAVLGCTGVANGLWSYSFMQTILEWIRLLPKTQKINE